jgi:hypothetical protein
MSSPHEFVDCPKYPVHAATLIRRHAAQEPVRSQKDRATMAACCNESIVNAEPSQHARLICRLKRFDRMFDPRRGEIDKGP